MRRLLLIMLAAVLLVPPIPIMKASYTQDVAIIDMECVSGFITYDRDERFRAKIFNSGNSEMRVDVEWYLDGIFIKRESGVNLSANEYSWTPPVVIHWPDDFRRHTVTAKVIISDSDPENNQRNETYRASFITSITSIPLLELVLGLFTPVKYF